MKNVTEWWIGGEGRVLVEVVKEGEKVEVWCWRNVSGEGKKGVKIFEGMKKDGELGGVR